METGNEYAHKGETIYLSERAYLQALTMLGDAWKAGQVDEWGRAIIMYRGAIGYAWLAGRITL